MFLLSIKTLLKKASKGNLKAQRLKLYNDNLHRGLADVLEHSDLQSCENKTELVSLLMQIMTAVGKTIEDYSDIQ